MYKKWTKVDGCFSLGAAHTYHLKQASQENLLVATRMSEKEKSGHRLDKALAPVFF